MHVWTVIKEPLKIKITSIATCFSPTWPSSGNCSLFENHRTALCLKSICFSAIVLSLFALKCVWEWSSLYSVLFSFCGVHVCAMFVCLFSLVGRKRLFKHFSSSHSLTLGERMLVHQFSQQGSMLEVECLVSWVQKAFCPLFSSAWPSQFPVHYLNHIS